MSIPELSILIIILAFLCEYIDSSLGMGYGTTLTPVLLIMGYSPLQVVPCVLLSELISGLSAAFFHHKMKNANFKAGTKDFKVAVVLATTSIFGTTSAIFVALTLPSLYVKLYIGILVFTMGALILLTRKKTFPFSWKKISGLGLVAAFNKGISGGGYGPIVTSGQLLSGMNSKAAVGITSLAEGLTCFVGVGGYLLFTNHTVDWSLAPSLIIGAFLSVPLAVFTVRMVKEKQLRLIIGLVTLCLGLLTLGKVIL